jgi:hypothetical protein
MNADGGGLNLNSTFDSLATHEPLAAAPSLAPYGASLVVERSQAPTINVVNQLDQRRRPQRPMGGLGACPVRSLPRRLVSILRAAFARGGSTATRRPLDDVGV